MFYGKLRRNIIFFILVCLLFCAVDTKLIYATAENYMQQNEKLDVVFVVDDSQSMIAKSEMCHNAMCNAVYSGVGSDIRVGSVYCTDRLRSKHYLTLIEDENSYKAIVKNYFDLPIHKERKQTVSEKLIESGMELFRHQDKTRKRIMILITDGVNTETNSDLSEQKKKLAKENIELYCALIGENTKKSEFENLLDTRKIFHINEGNMDLMTEKFADIFYGSRGDVQYQTVSLDEEGKYVFVIPKLNVTKLQTYARGNHIRITVIGPLGEKNRSNSWVDGFNVFLCIDNPTHGEWTIKIEGDNKKDIQNTKVTMAYYTELTASGKLTDNNGNSSVLKKNTSCILTADLSDSKGNSYLPDEGAEIKADIYFSDIMTDGKKSLYKSLTLRQEKGKLVSDEFEFNSYGTVDVEIHILYDDYIDIECITEHIAQVKAEAPYLIKNCHQKIICTVTENGEYVFDIDIGAYIGDGDSDINELIVDKVIYNKGDNRLVSVPYIENGRLKCKAEKLFGKIDSNLIFRDSTNLKVSLKMEGFIVNGTISCIFFGMILAGLLLVGVYYVFISPRRGSISIRDSEKSRKGETITKRRNEIKKQKAELKKNIDNLEKRCSDLSNDCDIKNYRINLSILREALGKKCIPQKIIDEITSEETALLETIDSKTQMFNQELQESKDFFKNILSDEQTEQINDTHKLSEIAEEIRSKNEELRGCLNGNIVSDTIENLKEKNRKIIDKKSRLQSTMPFEITVIFNREFGRAFKSDTVTYIASIEDFRVTGGAVMTVKNFLREQRRENLNIIFISSENADELSIIFAGREQISVDGTVQQSDTVKMTVTEERVRKTTIWDGKDDWIIVVKKKNKQ